jgi:hypothetical protein
MRALLYQSMGSLTLGASQSFLPSAAGNNPEPWSGQHLMCVHVPFEDSTFPYYYILHTPWLHWPGDPSGEVILGMHRPRIYLLSNTNIWSTYLVTEGSQSIMIGVTDSNSPT